MSFFHCLLIAKYINNIGLSDNNHKNALDQVPKVNILKSWSWA